MRPPFTVELPSNPERSDRSAIAEIARANLSLYRNENGTRIVFLIIDLGEKVPITLVDFSHQRWLIFAIETLAPQFRMHEDANAFSTRLAVG